MIKIQCYFFLYAVVFNCYVARLWCNTIILRGYRQFANTKELKYLGDLYVNKFSNISIKHCLFFSFLWLFTFLKGGVKLCLQLASW